jgi:hypothetical protein
VRGVAQVLFFVRKGYRFLSVTILFVFPSFQCSMLLLAAA